MHTKKQVITDKNQQKQETTERDLQNSCLERTEIPPIKQIYLLGLKKKDNLKIFSRNRTLLRKDPAELKWNQTISVIIKIRNSSNFKRL